MHERGWSAYRDWIERERLHVHEGAALNLRRIETHDWPRYGAKAALCQFPDEVESCAMIVLEIGARHSTQPVRHLYESVNYVLEGRGSTQFELPNGQKSSFEWESGHVFGIPMNVRHRHFNTDPAGRTLIASTVTAPMMMNMFRDADFIFETDFDFESGPPRDERDPPEGPGVRVSDDVATLPLDAGSKAIRLTGSAMNARVATVPSMSEQSGRHRPGTYVMMLGDGGCSFLRGPREQHATRVDWELGLLFPPGDQLYQHLSVGAQPTRYLATGIDGFTRSTNPGQPMSALWSLPALDRLATTIAAARLLRP